MIDSLRFCDIKLHRECMNRINHLVACLEKYHEDTEKYEDIYDYVPEEGVRRLLVLIHSIVIKYFIRTDLCFTDNSPDKVRITQYWEANSKKVAEAIASVRELQSLLLGSGLSLDVTSQWEGVFSGCKDGRMPYFSYVDADSIKEKPMSTLVRETEIVAGGKLITAGVAWLGKGSYANVYRFTNPFDSMDYALKVAKEDIEAEDLAAFKREYDILSGIDSEHVIRVYDYFRSANAFTMELMNCTLSEYWQQDQEYPEDKGSRLEILEQVFSGVMDINSRGIWHRDLSPSNILLRQERMGVTVKLSDFGVAKRIRDDHLVNERVVGFFNDRDDLERVGFANYGLPHEIYSLTLLALYVLERFDFKHHGGVNDKHDDFGGIFGSIVHKGLNDNPDARYDSVQDLWKDLKALVEANH